METELSDIQKIIQSIRNWNSRVPKRYRGLLEAKPYELGEDSDWYWSEREKEYIDKKDNKVSEAALAALLITLLIGQSIKDSVTIGGISYPGLANDLKNGIITLGEWQQGMRQLITMGHETSMLLANGGIEFMTQSDYLFLRDQIQKQFGYLDGFAKDISDNPDKWLNGRLDNRMRLYQESAYSAYQNDLRREAQLSGMDEERRVLGAADHCESCLDYAALGWQPIGTLPEIGDSDCRTNCRCEFEYRNSKDQKE